MTKAQRRERVSAAIGTKRPFNMSKWWGGGAASYVSQDIAMRDILLRGEVPDEVCGTSCCIAGEAAIQFPKEFAKVTARLIKTGMLQALYEGVEATEKARELSAFDGDTNPVAQVAAKVLGVSARAFYVDNWPDDLKLQYYGTDFDNRLKLVREVLNHFALPARS